MEVKSISPDLGFEEDGVEKPGYYYDEYEDRIYDSDEMDKWMEWVMEPLKEHNNKHGRTKYLDTTWIEHCVKSKLAGEYIKESFEAIQQTLERYNGKDEKTT